jgi:hypothetical protein
MRASSIGARPSRRDRGLPARYVQIELAGDALEQVGPDRDGRADLGSTQKVAIVQPNTVYNLQAEADDRFEARDLPVTPDEWARRCDGAS